MAPNNWQLVRSFLVHLVLQTNPLSNQPVLVDTVKIVKVPHVLSCMRKPFLVLSSLWTMQTTALAFGLLANVHVKPRFLFDFVTLNWGRFPVKLVLSNEQKGVLACN
jgi:hypothetical protein